MLSVKPPGHFRVRQAGVRRRQVAGHPANLDARSDHVRQATVVVFVKMGDHHEVDLGDLVRLKVANGPARGVRRVADVDQYFPAIWEFNQVAVGLCPNRRHIDHGPAGLRRAGRHQLGIVCKQNSASQQPPTKQKNA